MKKLYFILILVIFTLTSCKKVEDFCWDCEYIEINNLGAYNATLEVDFFQICNKTNEEIRDIENTYTRIICDYSSILKCKKAKDE